MLDIYGILMGLHNRNLWDSGILRFGISFGGIFLAQKSEVMVLEYALTYICPFPKSPSFVGFYIPAPCFAFWDMRKNTSRYLWTITMLLMGKSVISMAIFNSYLQ